MRNKLIITVYLTRVTAPKSGIRSDITVSNLVPMICGGGMIQRIHRRSVRFEEEKLSDEGSGS